jgi:hypothetical protein
MQVYDVDATTDTRAAPGTGTDNSDLKYLLVSSDPNDGAFTINEDTGVVSVASSLVTTQNRRWGHLTL